MIKMMILEQHSSTHYRIIVMELLKKNESFLSFGHTVQNIPFPNF